MSEEIVNIDGSHGEGGGQVLRCGVALSALTGRSVAVHDIRARRSKPGLAAQHLAAVLGVAEMCDGDVEGAHVGATEIVFHPGSVLGGAYEVDVGTAGSITLVLQSCLLASLHSPGATELVVKGGTNVRMSPPVDYYLNVLIPMLARMGWEVDVEVISRGFYPQGGGEVKARLPPRPPLSGLELGSRGRLEEVGGECFSQNLPEHIVRRMEDAVRQSLFDHEVRLRSDRTVGRSTGAGTTLYARFHNTVMGADGLGAKGLPAERVGEEAASGLRAEMEGGGTLDVHAADQLLPYMALAAEPSVFLVREVSAHLQTQMWLLHHFLPVEFQTEPRGRAWQVVVRPNRTFPER